VARLVDVHHAWRDAGVGRGAQNAGACAPAIERLVRRHDLEHVRAARGLDAIDAGAGQAGRDRRDRGVGAAQLGRQAGF
jgi:hypothetical protein